MRFYGRALRHRYGHAGSLEGFEVGAPAFADALRIALEAVVGDRQVTVRPGTSWGPGKEGDIYVTYINLPHGVGSAGGGAEAENNRANFWIRGFGREDAPSPSGKLRVEMSNSALYVGEGAPSRETRYPNLRSKSAAPGAIAKYLVDYLAKVSREVPPRFTHTGVLEV